MALTLLLLLAIDVGMEQVQWVIQVVLHLLNHTVHQLQDMVALHHLLSHTVGLPRDMVLLLVNTECRHHLSHMVLRCLLPMVAAAMPHLLEALVLAVMLHHQEVLVPVVMPLHLAQLQEDAIFMKGNLEDHSIRHRWDRLVRHLVYCIVDILN